MTMDPLRWEQVRSRFDELVVLPETERAERLRALEMEDPELGRALDSLLSADREADSELSDLDATLLDSAPSRSPAASALVVDDPLGITGQTVSHYRILGEVGSGGMGYVYRAEDTRLRRVVALKFLQPRLHLDDSARERFLQEARSAGSLDHPNLCTIHEVDETGWPMPLTDQRE